MSARIVIPEFRLSGLEFQHQGLGVRHSIAFSSTLPSPATTIHPSWQTTPPPG